MDCRVVVEAAVPVYDVGTADEAVRIAISKTGEMLNPDLNYVEIDMAERACPDCGAASDPAFIAADEGLVALELEMTVFNVDREEHASRVARKEIGQRLRNIPLEVLEVEVIETDDEEADDVSATNEADGVTAGDDDVDSADGESAATSEAEPVGGDDGEEEVLPEFEDLMDE
jgi:uncharacterized protein (UPF0212 family)